MSELYSFEYEGAPDPPFTIEQIGTESHTTYTIDWENRPDHDPQSIKKLHTAQIKLAVGGNGIREDFEEEYDAAMAALNDLVAAVTDYYVDDRESHRWYDLYMGNLEELPGVTKEVERVPVGDS